MSSLLFPAACGLLLVASTWGWILFFNQKLCHAGGPLILVLWSFRNVNCNQCYSGLYPTANNFWSLISVSYYNPRSPQRSRSCFLLETRWSRALQSRFLRIGLGISIQLQVEFYTNIITSKPKAIAQIFKAQSHFGNTSQPSFQPSLIISFIFFLSATCSCVFILPTAS